MTACEHKHTIVMDERIWCKVCSSFLPPHAPEQAEADLLAVAQATGVIR